MKKIFKQLRTIFAPVDKVFLVGFTALTVASLALGGVTNSWLSSTALGAIYIVWQVRRGAGR